jgi:RNA polymerase sigma factor (sigma-70 family)
LPIFLGHAGGISLLSRRRLHRGFSTLDKNFEMADGYGDEEQLVTDYELPRRRPIDQSIGASPIVPSAPSDAEPSNLDLQLEGMRPPRPPVVNPREEYIQSQTAVDPRYYDTPAGKRALKQAVPDSAVLAAQEAEKESNYQDARDQFNARQMLAARKAQQRELGGAQKAQQKELSAESEAALRGARVKMFVDAEGNVQPVRDEEGNIQYRPGKGPVTYDDQGHAVQTQFDTTGPKQVQLDQNAPIGPHSDRPGELYRQNKHSPWEYLGTVGEGLASKDLEIQGAAKDAQLQLDKHLHGIGSEALGRNVYTAAEALKSGIQDVQTKSKTVADLNTQLDAVTSDPRIKETEGGLFGVGAKPTSTALMLQQKRDQLSQELDQLTGEGYTGNPKIDLGNKLKDAKTAHATAVSERAAWSAVSPKTPGELDQILEDRSNQLLASGQSPDQDPVISAIKARKTELGIGAAPKPQDEPLRKDPVYGPILAERDALNADHDKAQQGIEALRADYENRLKPIAGEVQTAQAQLAPLQAQSDRFTSTLERLLGITEPSQDQNSRIGDIGQRIAQLTDPVQKAKVQTVLNALNPIQTELQRRQAELQPTLDAHAALVNESNQRVQEAAAAAETQLAPRRQALQQKLNDVADARIKALTDSFLRPPEHVLAPTGEHAFSPDEPAYHVNGDTGRFDIDPNRMTSGLLAARKDGAITPEQFATSFPAALALQKAQLQTKIGKAQAERDKQANAAQPLDYRQKGSTATGEDVAAESLIGFYGNAVRVLDQFNRSPVAKYLNRVGPLAFTGAPLLEGPVGKFLANQADSADKLRDPSLQREWHVKAANFLGAIAPAMLSGPADIPLLAGQGYQAGVDHAKQFTDDPAKQIRAGIVGGIINSALAVVFRSAKTNVGAPATGGATRLVEDGIDNAWKTGRAAGVIRFLDSLKDYPLRAGEVAKIRPALEKIRTELQTAPLTALKNIGGTLLRDSAIGAGVTVAQNVAARDYNPDQDIWEGAFPSAIEFGAFGGLGATVGAARTLRSARRDTATFEQFARDTVPSRFKPAGGLPSGPTTPTEAGGSPSPEAVSPSSAEVHAEIDGLQVPNVSPEQHVATQHALRGLVKIATGQPIDALTAAERAAVESNAPDGIDRVQTVKGKPVITQATLDRVANIAPTTRQILPASEEAQRQSILNPVEKNAPKSGSVESGLSQQDQKTGRVSQRTAEGSRTEPNVPQGTFAVEVQNARGETSEVEVQAADERAAHAQVAAQIPAGQGLIRSVTQISQPEKGTKTLADHAVEQIRERMGGELTSAEEKNVRNIAGVLDPHYQRWQRAFNSVEVSLLGQKSGGAGLKPGNHLMVSIPDIIRHREIYAGDKEHAANVMAEEAIHSVSTALEDRDPDTGEARGPIDLVKIFKALPTKVQDATKAAYKVKDATEYNYAHEFWRMFMQGQLELARGGKIKLKGKFLQEQSSRKFVVENRKALATLMRYFRNMEGELRRQKTSEDVISEVKRATGLLREKIKEVDDHARGASEVQGDETNAGKTGTAVESAPARGPPEPTGTQGAVAGAGGVGGIGPDGRGDQAPAETAGGTIESAAGRKLNVPEGAAGHVSKVTQNGRTLNVAYVAQEAAESRTSHDIQGRATPGYDQALQPRDRSLPQYRKQSQNIANDLNFHRSAFFPETTVPAATADIGAPIMTKAGDTIVGNGREIGIKAAYDQGGPRAAEYKKDFIRNARKFGIDPRSVARMKAPILKRVILDDVPKDELVRFSQESNEGAAMASNAMELAGQDASRITPDLLSLFDPNYAIDAAQNRDFVRAYLQTVTGQAGANEANFTPSDLVRRIRMGIFANAYGMDPTGRAAIERMAGDESDAGGRTITNALLTVSPLFARTKADIAQGALYPLDITSAIGRAAQDISEALRNKPAKQSASDALQALRQQLTTESDFDLGTSESGDVVIAVRDFLIDNRTNRGAIEEGLGNFVESVFALGDPREGQLFGEREVPSATQLFQKAVSPQSVATRDTERETAAAALRAALGSQPLTTPDVGVHDETTQRAQADLERIAGAAERQLQPAFREAVEADGKNGYPNLPGFLPAAGLTRPERIIEAHFSQIIASDKAGMLARYRKLAQVDFGTPHYDNADLARDLYPPYKSNPRFRLVLERSTIAPAGYVALGMEFSSVLRAERNPAKPYAMFLAGGMASGKTTSVNAALPELKNESALIYDSTFSNFDRASMTLEQSLAAGLRPVVVFVYRPFEAASQGVIDRLIKTGRPVRLAQQGNVHFDAQQTFFKLQDQFGDRVDFKVLFNDGKLEDIREEPVDALRAVAYSNSGETSRENLERTYGEQINRHYAAGRLDAAQYRALRSGSAADHGLRSEGGTGQSGLQSEAREQTPAGAITPARPEPLGRKNISHLFAGEVIHLRNWFDVYGKEHPASEQGGADTISINVKNGHRSLGLDVDNPAHYVGDLPEGGVVWRDDSGMFWTFDPRTASLRESIDDPLEKTAGLFPIGQTPALATQQLDLFGTTTSPVLETYARSLPAAAKSSRPALKRQLEKDGLGQLAGNETAVADLFALSNRAVARSSQQDGGDTGSTGPGAVSRGTGGASGASSIRPADQGEVPATGERGGRIPGQPGVAGIGGGGRETIVGGGGEVGAAERAGAPSRAGGGGEIVRPESERGTGGLAEPPRLVERPLPDNPSARNFVIERGTQLAPVGKAAKFDANLAAITLLKEIGGRDATPEEKAELAKYTGWGWAGEYFSDKPAYAKQNSQLKEILADDEYAAARASTVNAHYTAPEVISSMWDMVRRLGFEGGTVLEPAGGVGHFFALMPQDIARKSDLRGIELDKVSGKIFQKLYPESEIQVTGFQDAKIPNNSIDLAISNVPFGDYKVPGARDYPNLYIHDYFFARALDKVRPGGLVAFITSDGTMDKGDKRARELISQKADLVGAVRLPNTAFAENAGTEVTTDILLFRKKDNSIFNGQPFTRLTTVGDATVKNSEGKDERQDIRVNEYYAAHPENALGEHTLAGTMYGSNDYALVARPGQNTAGLLSEAASRLPENVIGERGLSAEERAFAKSGQLAESGQQEGSVQLTGDGEFRQVIDGRLEPPQWLTQKGFGKDFESTITPMEAAKREAIARDWLKLREATTRLINAENNPAADDSDLRLYRAQLNRAYDNYRIKWGTLNKRPGQQHNERARFLEDDPDYPLLQGLENERREVDANGRDVYHYDKADIFTKRIRTPKTMPETAKDTPDAVAISLGYTGKIDPALVGRLLSVDAKEATRQIVESGRGFVNPESGLLETRERYLSGNVRKKLRAAEEALAAGDESAQLNVDALKASLPERIPISGIYYNLGSRWMPKVVYEKYASQLLGSPAKVEYVPAMNRFMVKVDNEYSPENTTTWATKDFRGRDILMHGLNLTEPEVKKNIGTSSEPKYVRDDPATEAARSQLKKMRANFQSWLKTTTDTTGDKSLQEHVEDVYNELNNAMVPPQYSGDYLSLPGLSDVVDRMPHRLSVVARILQEGSAVMAHGVGSGKTFSQIVAAMEMRRLGLAKKPMIVVQKATIGQFASSFRQAYPDARILVANEKSFEKANRRRFMARIATGDYDSVIVTQPQFDRLPNREETVQNYFQERIDALEGARRAAAASAGKRDPFVKQIEKAKMRLQAKMQARLDALKSRQDFLPFEDLGVDSLLIDEAHAYKKISIMTNMRNVRGIPNDESQRAMGLEMKAGHVQATNNGRNVTLATGTPITNTMAEAYVMLKLATPHVLDEYGITNFDDFASTFGQTQTKLEYGWGGKWKLATRFNKFVNGAELITMIRSGFDVKMGNKELGLKVPKRKGPSGEDKPNLIIVPQTSTMANINDWIMSISDAFDQTSDKREVSHIPIVTMQAGMAAALDPRLIDPSLPDEPGSKVNHAVARVLDIYRENPGLTQVIFADRFKPMNVDKLREFVGGRVESVNADFEPEQTPIEDTPEGEENALAKLEENEYRSGGFNLYHDIREKLVKGGIPSGEIAIIHDFNTDLRRERLFNDLNAGKMRVVIGSTEKLGVGVNMQKKLIAMHSLDPPRMMTPAMVEQRKGRGIRQGNDNEEIYDNEYGSEKSMDTGIYQMLENKGRFIVQALTSKGVGRSFEDAADEATLSMAEMKALLTGDPRVLRKAELEQELTQLEIDKAGFEDQQADRARKLARARYEQRTTRTAIGRAEADAEFLGKKFDPENLTAEVGGEKISDRKEIGPAIDGLMRAAGMSAAKQGRFNSVASSKFSIGGVPLEVVAKTGADPTSSIYFSLNIFSPTEPSAQLRGVELNSGQGALQSVAAFARNSAKRLTDLRADAAYYDKQITELERSMGETWPHVKDYQAKFAELGKIEDSLLGKKRDAEGNLISATAQEAATEEAALAAQPLNTEAAAADAAKTPAERFKDALPMAMDIASGYRNIRGVSLDDVQQHARIALARASRAYDPSRQLPFGPLARTAINNELRGLYRAQSDLRAEQSLDVPTATGETAVAGLPGTSDVVSDVQRDEGHRLLNEAVSELPERMQGAITGILEGKTLDDIGAELGGISKQAVGRLATEAMRRLRGKLGERGISRVSDLLSQSIEEGLKSQETDNSIAELLNLLNSDAITGLQERAAAEKSGARTIGRPDLSLGAEGPEVMGVDEYRKMAMRPESEADWQRQAERMLKDDYDGTLRTVLQRALTDRGTLNPAETKAAQMLVAAEMGKPLTAERRQRLQALVWAYRSTGTEAGRSLAGRHDPFKTPEERNREFLAKAIFTPPAPTRRQIEQAGSAEERQRLLDADQARISRIEAELAKMGVNFEDILSGGYELRAKGAKLIENEMAGYDVPHQRALKLAQTGARSATEISKATGLTVAEVERVNDQFISSLRDKLRSKVQAGLTLEKIDLQGALLAQPAVAGGSKPVDVEAELDRIIRGMGFVASKDLGKMKVVKRRRPKLFVPPKVGGGRLPNEQAEVPYPEGQSAPYTGRVLGQIGLPLYQEIMIKRGADIGNVDDVVKIARVAQAAQGNAFDMVYEAWINNILSGPATHVANITGNLGSTALDFTLQRGMESLVNLVYRDANAAQLGEFRYIAKGLIPGIQRGLSLAVRAWAAEADFFKSDVLNEQVEMFEHFDKGGGNRPAIPGKAGRVVRMPGRALLFMDAFFKGAIGQMEAGAAAYRIAKGEGLSGKAMEDRINEQVATPNSEAWQRAVEKAINLTFQDPILTTEKGGGPLENAVARFNQMRSGSHILGFFFPFIRTPWNIFKIGLRKTPLGTANMFSKFAQAGFYRIKDGKPVFDSYTKAVQVRDLAEQFIAWATFAALWALTTGDDDDEKKPLLVTGSTPYGVMKKGERELWQRAYGGSYQIRVGGRNGTYFNYGRYEPIATVLGTVIDAIATLKKIKHGATLGQTLDSLHGYFLAQAQSKTFLQGFKSLDDATTPGDGSAGKSVFDTARRALFEALVPNLIRQPLRNLDEWVRDSRTAPASYIMAPVGALAQPKIDVYGNKVEKGENPISRLFFAAGTKSYPELQRADALLLRWNQQNPGATYAPVLPAATYKDAQGKNVQMTGEQARKFYERAGHRAAQMLRTQITQRQVEHPKEEDVKTIRNIFEEAHAQIKREMFPARVIRKNVISQLQKAA